MNRLQSISHKTNTSSQAVLAYAYSYNDANQRTRVNLADGSFWIYEYDSLGQVKSGKRYWSDWTPVAGQQFEYGFDDIGNRNSTKTGGDSTGGNLRSASYTNNTLNQITGRDVPAYLNVIGAASATATNVNVNNVMAYRRSEYYHVELNSPNTSAAVWQSVTNRAVQSGTTNSVTGNLFLPKQAEVFGYDADGNLINDGRWAYVWDGENRLLSITSRPSSPAGSSNALHFTYDWQGRRISKTVSNYSGSAWSKVLDEKYLYDGWNLLGSLNTSNNAVVCAFLWGSDLSGSMQGAGGVGGLLVVKAIGASVSFTAYDGNGNVTALINAAGGDALASYEYGPLGESVRASGTAAKTNPFRFSTKYQDDETDQIYYGYRYQNHSLGRWISRDPIAENGGLNLYGFVYNNTVNTADLLGLACAKKFSLAPSLIDALEKAWKASFGSDGTAAEQGGSIINTARGGQVIKPGKPGDSGSFPQGNFPQPGNGETLDGTYHTHPYSKDEGGYQGVSFSAEDIENFTCDRKQGNKKYVMAGTCIFVLTIDDPRKTKNCCSCAKSWNQGFDMFPNGEFPTRVEVAVRNAIKTCGLCYYKVCRENGKFPKDAILQN